MENPRLERERIVRDAKLGLILDAARNVFAHKGFHESRLEDIAVKAGFSKASLYNYFEDKETIFLTLAIRELDTLLEVLRNEYRPERNITDNLQGFMRAIFGFMDDNFAFFHAIMNLRTFDEKYLPGNFVYHKNMCSSFKQKFSVIFEICESMLRNGIEHGEIGAPFDASALTTFVIAIIRGIMFHWGTQGKTEDIKIAVENVILFLSGGLRLSERSSTA